MPLAELSELSRDERGGEGSDAWKMRDEDFRAGRKSEPAPALTERSMEEGDLGEPEETRDTKGVSPTKARNGRAGERTSTGDARRKRSSACLVVLLRRRLIRR